MFIPTRFFPPLFADNKVEGLELILNSKNMVINP